MKQRRNYLIGNVGLIKILNKIEIYNEREKQYNEYL